jgi:TonB family protein
MFETLVESRPRRRHSASQLILSLVAHAVVLTVAIRATVSLAEPPGPGERVPFPAWEAPVAPPLAAPPVTPHEVAIAPVAAVEPPPTLPVAPVEVPMTIPPIELGGEVIDRAALAVLAPVPDGPPTAGRRPGGPAAPGTPAALFRRQEVDQPARRVGGPVPRYPAVMRAVGIDGEVRLRFVVGLDGRAEAGTITVLSSTNVAFEPDAIETIRRSTFRPAMLAGGAVRQLVEQVVRYRLAG